MKIINLIKLDDGEIIKKYTHKEISFYITNYGRLFNLKGQPLKPQIQRVKDKHTWKATLKIQLNIRRKDLYVRYSLSLPRLVYKLFVDKNINDKSRVVFKDGNHFNCRYDNLDIGIEHKKTPPLSKEKLELFNSPITIKTIERCLCWWYGTTKLSVNNNLFDFEDLVMESLMVLYKALNNYQHENEDKYKGYVFQITRKFICSRYTQKTDHCYYDDKFYYKSI